MNDSFSPTKAEIQQIWSDWADYIRETWTPVLIGLLISIVNSTILVFLMRWTAAFLAWFFIAALHVLLIFGILKCSLAIASFRGRQFCILVRNLTQFILQIHFQCQLWQSKNNLVRIRQNSSGSC